MKIIGLLLGLGLSQLSNVKHMNTSSALSSDVRYEAWYVKQNTLFPYGFVSNWYADLQKRGPNPLNESSAPFDVAMYGMCFVDPVYICIVLIKYEDGTPSDGVIEDFKYGDSGYIS